MLHDSHGLNHRNAQRPDSISLEIHHVTGHWGGRLRQKYGQPTVFNPDSPDEMMFGQLRASISAITSSSYTGSDSRVLTDPTGERRNPRFRQRFRGLWP